MRERKRARERERGGGRSEGRDVEWKKQALKETENDITR